MNDLPKPPAQDRANVDQRPKKGLFIAAAPVLLLTLLVLGLRYLPTAAPIEEKGDNSDTKAILGKRQKQTPLRPQAVRIPPQPVDAETQKKVEEVVRGQVTALSTGDYKTALTYSDSHFRAGWTPEMFGNMVQSGPYEPLRRAKKQSFRPAQQAGSACMLPLTVSDATGQKAQFVYVVGKEATGWSVISCSRTDVPPHPYSNEPPL